MPGGDERASERRAPWRPSACVGGAKYNAVCTQRVITGQRRPGVCRHPPYPPAPPPAPTAPHTGAGGGWGRWESQQGGGGTSLPPTTAPTRPPQPASGLCSPLQRVRMREAEPGGPGLCPRDSPAASALPPSPWGRGQGPSPGSASAPGSGRPSSQESRAGGGGGGGWTLSPQSGRPRRWSCPGQAKRLPSGCSTSSTPWTGPRSQGTSPPGAPGPEAWTQDSPGAGQGSTRIDRPVS